MLLMDQGTTPEEEKASITTFESVSSQKFLQPFSSAISMVVMAAQNSAKIAEPGPKLLAKQPKQSKLEFLNMPPQDDWI